MSIHTPTIIQILFCVQTPDENNLGLMLRQVNYWVVHRILTKDCFVEPLSITTKDHVIEIGPGKGHTTSLLLKRCRKVTAVEIDEKLYRTLLDKFCASQNLKLYHQDFLKWCLPASGNYKVFANIPFCHTTDILRKLTESKNPPTEAWLIMEKGAAKRFMGIPHETLRSLMIKPVFDIGIIYYFRRDNFHPKPGIDVVLVHLKKKAQPDVPVDRLRDYKLFISKGLKNNGIGLRSLFTKKQLSRAFREAGIQQNCPSGEMLYIQWLCLFRCYCHYVLHVS